MDAPRSRRIDGNAVVTTRLSRVVMNSARLTTAKVQPARVCDCLLTLPPKKEGVSGFRERTRPRLVDVLGVHRRHHVEEHPAREPRRELLVRGPRRARDELVERAEAAADGLAHDGVVD